MNIAVLPIEIATIEQSFEEVSPFAGHESEQLVQDQGLPVKRRFGLVDLWNIRGTKGNSGSCR